MRLGYEDTCNVTESSYVRSNKPVPHLRQICQRCFMNLAIRTVKYRLYITNSGEPNDGWNRKLRGVHTAL